MSEAAAQLPTGVYGTLERRYRKCSWGPSLRFKLDRQQRQFMALRGEGSPPPAGRAGSTTCGSSILPTALGLDGGVSGWEQ